MSIVTKDELSNLEIMRQIAFNRCKESLLQFVETIDNYSELEIDVAYVTCINLILDDYKSNPYDHDELVATLLMYKEVYDSLVK